MYKHTRKKVNKDWSSARMAGLQWNRKNKTSCQRRNVGIGLQNHGAGENVELMSMHA